MANANAQQASCTTAIAWHHAQADSQ